MGEKAGFRDVRQPARGHTACACLMPAVPDSSVDTPGGLQGQARLPSSIVKEGRRELQLTQPCRHWGCFIDGAPQLSTRGGPCRCVIFVQKMLGGRRLPNRGVPCLWCPPSSVVAPPSRARALAPLLDGESPLPRVRVSPGVCLAASLAPGHCLDELMPRLLQLLPDGLLLLPPPTSFFPGHFY